MVARPAARDRAQLFLIGGVAIAMVVVGLVVVLNGVVFNQAVTTSAAGDATESADRFDRRVTADVRALLVRINHDERDVAKDGLRRGARRNTSNLSRLWAESYATSGADVDVSLDPGTITWGARLVQSEDGTLTDDGARITTPEQELGRFLLNIDVAQTNTAPTTITVENDSESIAYRIERASGGQGPELRVETVMIDGSTRTDQCDPAEGRVLLDLFAGTAYGGECSFGSLDALEPPHTLEISDGDDAYGRFALVGARDRADWSGYPDCTDPEPTDEPCLAPAIWSGNVTAAYHSNGVAFDHTHNLSVYP